MTQMIVRGHLCVVLALTLCAAGCTQRLVRKFTCEQVRSLQPGQSQDDVLRILGAPRYRDPGSALPWHVKPYLAGEEWRYDPQRPRWARLWTEKLAVRFAAGRLTWVSASRDFGGPDGRGEVVLDYWRDPRNGTKGQKIGAQFDELFPCDVKTARR